MTETKKNSATAFGLLDCPQRVLCEGWLGYERDRRALDRGVGYHLAVEGLNRLRKGGMDVGQDEIKQIVMGQKFDPILSGDIEDAITWFAARTHGIVPIAVEDDGGRWVLKIGGIDWTGKWDCVYVNSESGRITVTDYKSGFLPDKDEMKKTVQCIIYAKAAMLVFGVSEVDMVVVSLRNKFSYILEYDGEFMERYWPYIERDGAKVHKLLEILAFAKDDGSLEVLRASEDFKPRLHAWCPYCAAKKECKEYQRLIWLPEPYITGHSWSRPEAVQHLRERSKLVDHEKDAVEKDLKADASEGPVSEGGYVAEVKITVQQVKPTPGGERTVRRLVIMKEDECESLSPSESNDGKRKSIKNGVKDGSGTKPESEKTESPSAESVTKSRTKSSKKTADGNTRTTSSTSDTTEAGHHTPRIK